MTNLPGLNLYDGEEPMREDEFYVHLQWPDDVFGVLRAGPDEKPWKLLKAHSAAVEAVTNRGVLLAAVVHVSHVIRPGDLT